MRRVGLNRTYTVSDCIHTVYIHGSGQYINKYTYIYGSGQPYTCVLADSTGLEQLCWQQQNK